MPDNNIFPSNHTNKPPQGYTAATLPIMIAIVIYDPTICRDYLGQYSLPRYDLLIINDLNSIPGSVA